LMFYLAVYVLRVCSGHGFVYLCYDYFVADYHIDFLDVDRFSVRIVEEFPIKAGSDGVAQLRAPILDRLERSRALAKLFNHPIDVLISHGTSATSNFHYFVLAEVKFSHNFDVTLK